MTDSTAKTKFTPGPWKVTKGDEHHGDYVESWTGETVCDLYFMSNKKPIKHGIDSSDNAHLIAAAPDMYAMLERFLPYVTYDDNGEEVFHGGEFQWSEDDDPMIDELKKLLAKARGEQEE